MLGKAPHPYPEQGRRRSFLAHLLPWDAAQIPSCQSLNCKCCRPRPPAEEPETERSVSLRKSQRKGGAAVRTQSPGSSLCAAPPEGDGDRTLMSPCHQHRISWRNHREGRELVLHRFLPHQAGSAASDPQPLRPGRDLLPPLANVSVTSRFCTQPQLRRRRPRPRRRGLFYPGPSPDFASARMRPSPPLPPQLPRHLGTEKHRIPPTPALRKPFF